MKRYLFAFLFLSSSIVAFGQELELSPININDVNVNGLFNSCTLTNCSLTIPNPVDPILNCSSANVPCPSLYRALFNQLTNSSLKGKIELVKVPGSSSEDYGTFGIDNYKYLIQDGNYTGGFNKIICPGTSGCLPASSNKYLNYFIGDLTSIQNVNGPFTSFRPQSVSNGLFFLSHNLNNTGNPSINCMDVTSDNLLQLFLGRRDLLMGKSIIPIRSFNGKGLVESGLDITYRNKLNTRFYIFRDLIMSSNERIKYDKNQIPSGLNFNLQSCFVSNMTYYRFYFKVKEDLNQSETDLFANFKLFTNESTEVQSKCPDLFSIRIADFTQDVDPGASTNFVTTIPIPHYDIISPGYASIGNSKNGFKLVENSPRVFRQGIVMDDLNRLKVGNPIMGFKYGTRLMSYKYTLKKDHLYSIIIGIADVGTRGPGEVSGLMVQLSDSPSADYLLPNEPECDPLSFATSNPCCNTGFSPYMLKEYLMQGWIKNTSASTPQLAISFEGNNQNVVGTPQDFEVSKIAIDGWIKVNARFFVPASASKVKFSFSNSGSSSSLYVDDLRIIPVNSEAKSFVVDAVTRKPIAEFDSENNGTYFIYNTDGTLIQTKKETSKGVRTLTVTTGNE